MPALKYLYELKYLYKFFKSEKRRSGYNFEKLSFEKS